MKTPEKIKKGMKLCKPIWKGDHWKTCDEKCPYRNEGSLCREMLNTDALALIQQLEAENAELKRERDAAVNDLTESQFCHACKHCEEKEELAAYHDVPAQCVNCAYEISRFLWRGPCEENGVQKEENT